MLRYVVVAILIMLVLLPFQAAAASPSQTTLSRLVLASLKQLWDPETQALKTSPVIETQSRWPDDHGKILQALSYVADDGEVRRMGDALVKFINRMTLETGFLIRKTLVYKPEVLSGEATNFHTWNKLITVKGDLSRTSGTPPAFRIEYGPPDVSEIVYIQGYAIYYNGTEKDLSNDPLWRHTSYDLIAQQDRVVMRYVWDKPDFYMILDYAFVADRPWLEMTLKITPRKVLTDLKFSFPYDQLDYFGPAIAPGAPRTGYDAVYIPGLGVQTSDDSPVQVLMSEEQQKLWVASGKPWTMIYSRNRPDGHGMSPGIVTYWGHYQGKVVSIINVQASPLPPDRLPNRFHYIKHIIRLTNQKFPDGIPYAEKNVETGARALIMVLNSVFWHEDMAKTYGRFFDDPYSGVLRLDPSASFYQGATAYGLLKWWRATGDRTSYDLAKSILLYYWNSYQSHQSFGAAPNNLAAMIRSAILIAQHGPTAQDRALFAKIANTYVDKLLSFQELDARDPRYGGFREPVWYGTWNNQTKLWLGNVYLDHQALAMLALIDKLRWTGNNVTISNRLSLAINAIIVTSHDHIDTDGARRTGMIAVKVDDSNTNVDTCWTAPKCALVLEALHDDLALGYNHAITLKALSQLLWATVANETHVMVKVFPGHIEPNTESLGWGLSALFTYSGKLNALNDKVKRLLLNNDGTRVNITSLSMVVASDIRRVLIDLQAPAGLNLTLFTEAELSGADGPMGIKSKLYSHSLYRISYKTPGSHLLSLSTPPSTVSSFYNGHCVKFSGSAPQLSGYLPVKGLIPAVINSSSSFTMTSDSNGYSVSLSQTPYILAICGSAGPSLMASTHPVIYAMPASRAIVVGLRGNPGSFYNVVFNISRASGLPEFIQTNGLNVTSVDLLPGRLVVSGYLQATEAELGPNWQPTLIDPMLIVGVVAVAAAGGAVIIISRKRVRNDDPRVLRR